MSDIEALLHDAGERWRASQPAPPKIDAALFAHLDRTLPSSAFTAAAASAAAAIAVVIVAFISLQFGGSGGTGGGPAIAGSDGSRALNSSAASSPLPSCDVTKPVPAFVPPEGELIEAPFGEAWFGRAGLYTALDVNGDVWDGLPKSDAGWGQKTFWWSVDWLPDEEPAPAIRVTGERLDAPGTLAAGPGTNASAADIGTAMLVGVTFPEPGCWRLTARYRDASLSYTVLVISD
jgi:hypothetical protein